MNNKKENCEHGEPTSNVTFTNTIEFKDAGRFESPMNKSEELREQLAELEHEQWCAWSKNLAENEEGISVARLERWQELWKPYAGLTEEQKDQDREWADKVLVLLNDALAQQREEIVKMIKGKAKDGTVVLFSNKICVGCGEYGEWCQCNGYNRAINDITNLITAKAEE